VLRILGVSLSIAGRRILEEISLQARAGEMVILDGARGAGKSALLQIAAALRRPDAGEVWIADRDVTALQRSSLPYVRRNVGYLGDDVPLLDDASVLDNVLLALAARGEPQARARELALRALGRVDLIDAASRRVATLSGAERRLCGAARAFAGAPPLLILDDPSAGLGPGDGEALLAAVGVAVEMGSAVLSASADDAFVAAAVKAGARRVRLDGGRVLPGGGPIAVPASRWGSAAGSRIEAAQ
jgi:cell division transport system ATP-binding protein